MIDKGLCYTWRWYISQPFFIENYCHLQRIKKGNYGPWVTLNFHEGETTPQTKIESVFCFILNLSTSFRTKKKKKKHPEAKCLRNYKMASTFLQAMCFTTAVLTLWSVTQELLGLLRFECHTIFFRMLTFQESVDTLKIRHKTNSSLFGV